MTWPVGGIPVRPFDGFVKRVRVDENEGLARHILDLAFPLFRGTNSVSTQEGRVRADFYGNDRNIQLPGRQPRRRFSGGLPGESLPRGRYYSLCREFPPGSKEAKTRSRIRVFSPRNCLRTPIGRYQVPCWCSTGVAAMRYLSSSVHWPADPQRRARLACCFSGNQVPAVSWISCWTKRSEILPLRTRTGAAFTR